MARPGYRSALRMRCGDGPWHVLMASCPRAAMARMKCCCNDLEWMVDDSGNSDCLGSCHQFGEQLRFRSLLLGDGELGKLIREKEEAEPKIFERMKIKTKRERHRKARRRREDRKFWCLISADTTISAVSASKRQARLEAP